MDTPNIAMGAAMAKALRAKSIEMPHKPSGPVKGIQAMQRSQKGSQKAPDNEDLRTTIAKAMS